MSKFMLIFHGGFYNKLSPEETQKQTQKWFSWVEKLQKQGKYKSGEPLLPGGKIVTQKNGKLVVDGPFVESKEEVAGYFVVEASNVDEVIQMSNDYPDFHLGGKVEVREVMNIM